MDDPGRLADARTLFEYLYLRDPEDASADAVIGFGHFDLKIPRRCLDLYRQDRASLIVFTGGMGAGTADLGRPEAWAFLDELRAAGGVPDGHLLFEDQSTNTGENVAATARLLEQRGRPFGSDEGIRVALIVATAYRQRRVFLTCHLHHPRVRFINAPPLTSFEAERAMFGAKQLDLVALLSGEIQRLLEYPDRGLCLPAEIPPEVLAAHRGIRSRSSQSGGGEERGPQRQGW
jgi:hypothetical protein